MSILWFLNLNQTLDQHHQIYFQAVKLLITKVELLSSNQFTYIIDSNNGSILSKENFSNKNIRPIIFNELIFFITNNNFLICMNLEHNEIIYTIITNTELISVI